MSTNQAPVLTTGDGDGIVTLDFGSFSAWGPTVALQADGKVVVNSYAFSLFAPVTYSALVRYNADGSLDTAFGTDGVIPSVSHPVFSTRMKAGVAVQADGKLLTSSDGYAVTRYNSDGSLDTSFGAGGKVVLSETGVSFAYGVLVEPDRNIIATGDGNNFGLARFDGNGSLDASFGVGGQATASFGNSIDDLARSVVSAPDGKLIVAGIADDGQSDFALVRYSSDGILDATFGASGKVTTDFAAHDDGAVGVAVQADGKIVASGVMIDASDKMNFALVRYNVDGSLDASFGTGGKVTTDVGNLFEEGSETVKIQSDGKIVVAGFTYADARNSSDFALIRYNSDGSLDTSFGSGGKVVTNLGSDGDHANDLVIEPDGKILVVGKVGISGSSSFDVALVRYNSDGSLDTSFGDDAALIGPAFFIEGGSPTVLNGHATVHDAELDLAGSYAGASLALARHGGADAQDVFGASGNLSALTEGGNLVLSGVTVGTVTHDSGGMLSLAFGANATEARVNDAPVTTVPAPFSTFDNTDHAVTGLSVSDPDSTTLSMEILAHHGTLTVGSSGGAIVQGNGSFAVSLKGTAAQIDAALGAPNNVLYHSTAGFHGTDSLLLTSSDGGSGPSTVFNTVAVTVMAKNPAFDFNGDSFSDILFRDNATGDTTYLDVHNNVFNSLGGSAAADSVVGTGDLNGDNFGDVLWRNNSTGDTSYFDVHNNVSHSLGGSPAAYSVVAIGDFNGDSFSDVLWRNNSTGDTGYTDIHNGGYHSLGGSPTTYGVVGIGDLNGDGFSDLLWRNNSTGDTGYTDIHNGGYTSLGGSPTTYGVVGIGDFNGDHFSDILFRNNSSGDTGYTDIHNLGYHGLGGSPTAYAAVGVADYNGDGFGDILFQDHSTGNTGYTDAHNGGFHSVSAPSAAYLVMA